MFKTNFQFGHSTEHAILQLANQIHETMEKNLFTFDAFIDLSEVFDTVNHSIIFKELKKSWHTCKNLEWFESYLRILNTMFKLMTTREQKFNKLHVEFHRDQYWDRFGSYSMLTACRTPQ